MQEEQWQAAYNKAVSELTARAEEEAAHAQEERERAEEALQQAAEAQAAVRAAEAKAESEAARADAEAERADAAVARADEEAARAEQAQVSCLHAWGLWQYGHPPPALQPVSQTLPHPASAQAAHATAVASLAERSDEVDKLSERVQQLQKQVGHHACCFLVCAFLNLVCFLPETDLLA